MPMPNLDGIALEQILRERPTVIAHVGQRVPTVRRRSIPAKAVKASGSRTASRALVGITRVANAEYGGDG